MLRSGLGERFPAIGELAVGLRRMLTILSSGWRPAALIGALLLLPLIYDSPNTPGKHHIGLPRVYSGDEPHYLVMINSLLLDGDLDLANNYAAVHNGASEAGRWFSGWPLDHHTVWFEGTTRREWRAVYEDQPPNWDQDSEGHPVPRLRVGQSVPVAGHTETSTHPPGLALLLAPLLLPFRNTALVEPLAIACSALATIIAMLVFRNLIRSYAATPAAELITAVTFLATPIWHYARSLFTEPYLLLFAIVAYSTTLRGRSPFLAGVMIGLGLLMKPTFILLGLPLLALYVVARNGRAALLFALPMAASLAATIGYDAVMLGSPWRAVQEWRQGSLPVGAWKMLFSPTKGLLISAPATVVALAAWPRFFRTHRRDATVLMAAILLNYVFFASYAVWWGGSGYSVRYMVPVLPLVFVSLVSFADGTWPRSRVLRGTAVALCVLSGVVNARAAIQYWKSWDTNPIYAALYPK
jgi:hypothetical protein